MLHLAFAAGLRVSELVGLQLNDLELRPPATIHVQGKGRRERVLPLWKETVTALRDRLAVRTPQSASELFLNARGQNITRAGFEYILAKHVNIAAVHQTQCVRSVSHPTYCAIPARCIHSRQRTMSARSHSGSDTRHFKARRSTCALTRQKSWKPCPP